MGPLHSHDMAYGRARVEQNYQNQHCPQILLLRECLRFNPTSGLKYLEVNLEAISLKISYNWEGNLGIMDLFCVYDLISGNRIFAFWLWVTLHPIIFFLFLCLHFFFFYTLLHNGRYIIQNST